MGKKSGRTVDEQMKTLIDAAVSLAEIRDYDKLSRQEIAKHARVSPGLISFYLGGMPNVKAIIMKEAVARKIPVIVARGILDNHPEALKASPALRKKCAALFK